MALRTREILVLGSAAPGLGQHDDWYDGADAGAGEFIMQSQEVGVAPFGGDQGRVAWLG